MRVAALEYPHGCRMGTPARLFEQAGVIAQANFRTQRIFHEQVSRHDVDGQEWPSYIGALLGRVPQRVRGCRF